VPSLHTSHELARDAKSLQKAAVHLPAARERAQRLQAEAESALAEAEALKLQARLDDLHRPARDGLREIATESSRPGAKDGCGLLIAGPCGSSVGSLRRLGVSSRIGCCRNSSILFKGIC
jgi:hypothetical protein